MGPPEVLLETEEKKVNLRESMASHCTIQAKVNQKIRQPPSEGSPSAKGDNTASFNGSYKNGQTYGCGTMGGFYQVCKSDIADDRQSMASNDDISLKTNQIF